MIRMMFNLEGEHPVSAFQIERLLLLLLFALLGHDCMQLPVLLILHLLNKHQ